MMELRDLLYAEMHARTSGPKPTNHIVACELLLATGARISEVCALDWEDGIDLEGQRIIFSSGWVEEDGKMQMRPHLKNQDPHRISHMPTYLKGILESLPHCSGPVLQTRNGNRCRPCNIRRTWRAAYDRAGVPEHLRLTPHDLRREVRSRHDRDVRTLSLHVFGGG